MRRWHDARGFTLVEMLVVIGIIAVLVAIIFPTFTTAREKSRQARCRTNLMQLVTQLKVYRTDYGLYPSAWAWDSDPATGWVVGVWYNYHDGYERYEGGVSALYPDYIQDRNLLICPDDKDVKIRKEEATSKVYSSYNGTVDFSNWSITGALYNYYGYTYVADSTNGASDGYEEITAPLHTSGGPQVPPGWMDIDSNSVPDWLQTQSLRWGHFPALSNPHAPDSTIVTHCRCHRQFYSEERQRDVVVRLNGESETVEVAGMETPHSSWVTDWNAGATEVAPWVHQSF